MLFLNQLPIAQYSSSIDLISSYSFNSFILLDYAKFRHFHWPYRLIINKCQLQYKLINFNFLSSVLFLVKCRRNFECAILFYQTTCDSVLNMHFPLNYQSTIHCTLQANQRAHCLENIMHFERLSRVFKQRNLCIWTGIKPTMVFACMRVRNREIEENSEWERESKHSNAWGRLT